MINPNPLRSFFRYYRFVPVVLVLDIIFALLMTAVSISVPFVIQYVTQFAIDKNIAGIIYTFIVLIGLLLLRMISQFYVSFWGNLMGNKLEIIMRKEATAKLHRLDMKYFDNTNSGTVVSRVVHDLRDITQFAHRIPEDFLIGFATAAGGLTFAFLTSWIVGTVLLSIFSVTMVFWILRSRAIKTMRKKVRAQNAVMSSSIANQVEGITESKSYANTNLEQKRFAKIQLKYNQIWRKTFGKIAVWDTFNIFIVSMISFSVILIGAIQVNNDTIDVAQLAGLTSVGALMVQPIHRFIQVYTMYSAGLASIERFYEFMAEPEEKAFGTLKVPKIKGKIEFRNVDFGYETPSGEKRHVLKNFNIVIPAGQKIAFVGETGIGKSTILKLILGFYTADKGEILIDDINLNEYDIVSLRKLIAYLQQNSVIFMNTIFKNIQYGNHVANVDQVQQAAKAAQIHESIIEMPDGYETFSGPSGTQLSGGQKQRIAIARAFLKQSSMLLMDEATSSLDNQTEKYVKEAINRISYKKTAVIVAHRLTTIKEVDRVIVFGKYGKIIEEGTHDELISKNGIYAMLSKIK